MTRREEIIQAANNYKAHFPDGFINEFIYIDGAEWADKTMLDKVCKRLEELFTESDENPHVVSYQFDSIQEMIEDLRKTLK